MDESGREMSQERLAEIRARLAERPPVSAVAASNRDKSPVATYLSVLRNDQIELLREIDRLKAQTINGARSLEEVG